METTRTATPDGDTPPRAQPVLPQMLSHAAFMSRDTTATVEFFTKILGMEFVGAVLDDRIPSTGGGRSVLPLLLPHGRWVHPGVLRGPGPTADR